MNEQQVQQMIQQALSSWSAKSQYGVSAVPVHAHTGYDGSPKVSYGNLTNVPAASVSYYTGVVTSNAAGTPFPSGWSVAHGSTGEYTITHDLGTTDYTVSALSHSSYFCQLTSKGSSSFLLIWWASQSATDDCDFDFTVFPSSATT